jgi:hypothetical protein
MPEVSTEEILGSLNTGNDAPLAETATEGAPWWSDKLKENVEYQIEGGKKVSEPFEMILKRAGLGYHYAQRAHGLNQQEEKYKTLEQQNQQLARWQQYDEYARQNPDWAKYVEENWNNRQNLVQSNQNNPQISALQQELMELKKFRDEFQTERQKERESHTDQRVSKEIDTVAKQYGVDLSQTDEQGLSLEWRVLDHAKKMGLDGNKPGFFNMAFRDYYFDNLVGQQKEKAVEQVAKNQVELKKAGIRDIKSTPKKSESLDSWKPGMSRNDTFDAALKFYQSNKKAS